MYNVYTMTFNAILYINLEHRKDRENSILSEIGRKLPNIPVYRIDAVLESLCGHIGCGKSHIKAIELAIRSGWQSVLILEDDFVFTNDYKGEEDFTKLDGICWDVMLLARGHHDNKDSKYDFLKRARRATTASGYIVKQHYYSTLLENFRESVVKMEAELKNHSEDCVSRNIPISKLNYCSAIDQQWFSLQERDIFYMFDPPIGTQGDYWSDNNCSCEHQINKITGKRSV